MEITLNIRQISEKTLGAIRKAISAELSINSKMRKSADSVALRRKEGELLEVLVKIDKELVGE